jgi:hypothetical protein
MADIPQVLATYDALVGVALGAGLTYGFGTLNRRHQEKRENETRWYEERLRAYVAFSQAVYEGFFRMGASAKVKAHLSGDEIETLIQRLVNDLGTIYLVGSPEVIEAAEKTLDGALDQIKASYESHDFSSDFLDELERFRDVARKDLGHPSP